MAATLMNAISRERWTRDDCCVGAAAARLKRSSAGPGDFGGKTYDAVAEMLQIECDEVARLMQQALRRLHGQTALSLIGPPRTA
jgi:hypothetical protein